LIKTKTKSIGIVALGVLSILIIGTAPLVLHINAQEAEQKFTAKLSGKDEVPSNKSPSTGFAWVRIIGDKIAYKVNVTDMDKVNAAHIHLGSPGKNGPEIGRASCRERV